MDVSPKTLREVEFREKMRGYHPEDVDQFLERVAAGIEVLQDRLRQAIERAQRAEQAATEAGGNDDALRRTLLLAQRTADLAVQEAREQAARIVAGAEQQSQSLVGDAEQRAHSLVAEAERRAQSGLADAERRSQAMVSEAEQRARRGHEDAMVQVRADLAKLEATRQRLQMDVDTMTRWVAEHRHQLRAALEDALTRIEQIDVSSPPSSGVPYPPGDQDAPPSTSPPSTSPPVSSPEPATSSAPLPAGGAEPTSAWAPAATPAPPVAVAPAAVAPAAVAPAGPAGPTPAPTDRRQEDTVAWAPPEHDLGAKSAAATEEGGEADPYFAELRRAISDHDPLGPRPEQDSQGSAGEHAAPGGEL